MGSKTHRRGKTPSTAELFQHARRSFEKHDFKQAYKDAKVCYQQEPTPEHRALLEQAWFARVQGLLRSGLTEECRGVLENLLDFGVTEPALKEQLPGLLMAAGLFDRVAAQQLGPAGQASPEILQAAADRAVVDFEHAPTSLPEIRPGAQRVLAALEAVTRGDETQALAELKDLPRSSPFADWKLFVRGLAAYYRLDDAEMQANWDRLEPARLAAKIAAPLRALAGPSEEARAPAMQSAVYLLEKDVFGEPMSGFFTDLQTHQAADDWKPLLRTLRQAQKPLQRAVPELWARVCDILYGSAIRGGEWRRLEDLMAQIPALPLDPRWNRAQALLFEGGLEGDCSSVDGYWRAYLDDLARVPSLTPEERVLAQALVWDRLGGLWMDDAIQRMRGWGEDDEGVERMQARVVECCEAAIRLAPDYLPSYEHLTLAYAEWKREDEVAGVFRRIQERFPDNLEALQFLFQYHFRHNEGIAARDCALRLQHLKPADPAIKHYVWMGHAAAARAYAISGQWDLGRAELAAAEQIDDAPRGSYPMLVRKGIFEIKAGDATRGREFIQQAKAAVDDPAPVLLMLAIEAVRYEVGFSLDLTPEAFQQQWLNQIKRKRSTRTAGRMAEILVAHAALKTDYPGLEAHVEQVSRYIRGCLRNKWEVEDLWNACHLVLEWLEREVQEGDGEADEGEEELLDKLAKKGMKYFPNFAGFHFAAGMREIVLGPYEGDSRHARQCFERARDLAEKSSDPRDAALLEMARRQLTFLEEQAANDSPFRILPPDLDDFDEDDEYWDDEDDEEDLDPGSPASDALPRLPGMPKNFAEIVEKMSKNMGLDPGKTMPAVAKELAKMMERMESEQSKTKSNRKRGKK